MNKELKSITWLRQLSEFWPYLRLCNELQKQIDWLWEEIIGSIGEWEKKYTMIDLKRVERLLLQQFLELPEHLIEEFDSIIETIDKESEGEV